MHWIVCHQGSIYLCTMKQTIRQRQVGEIVKRHFSQVLQQEGRLIYGNEALVTVTQVYMSPDLGIAKVYLSIWNVENKQEVVLVLENELLLLRQKLANRLKKHVRRIPELRLYMDDTLDEMYHLTQVFDRLRAENQMGEEE